MDCAFCIEFNGTGPDHRIIWEESGWVLLPTLGCFTPGYCLFMPVSHFDAAADVPKEELAHVAGTLEIMRGRVESVFGPTIVAEHGSRDCRLGAGCCTHCHLHLIPVPDPDAVTEAYRRTGGDGLFLAGLSDLADVVTGPYLHLSPRPSEHFVWPADARFARQFVRRICAGVHGAGEKYDWRDHPYPENQQITARLLRAGVTDAA